MTDALPIRQFSATDPQELRLWLADLHQRYADDSEGFDDVLTSVIGRLGMEYQKVSAALRAKGRGQRQGGSEAFTRQETIDWAERAEERATDSEEPTDKGEAEEAEAQATSSSTKPEEPPKPADPPPPPPPRNRGHRRPFPASWPRTVVEISIDPASRVCPVCGLEKVCIGHVVNEVLAIVPAQIYVKQYLREKLACAEGHAGVVTAPPEPRLVPASSCDLTISLDLLDRKLIQYQPIHRVQQVYERLGCLVSEATLGRWYHDGLRALHIVALAIRVETMAPERFLLNIDDTGIPILDNDAEGGLLVGHMWLVVGDGLFVSATASRDWTKEHAVAALGTWTGYVQADAYRGFDAIFKKGPMVEVGCWAHARRYFVKAKDRGDLVAEEALGLIGRMYAVETRATEEGLDADQRHALRKELSRPALDLLWKWTTKVGGRARPKSPLGKALRYLANQRQALERYLEDGRLSIDNMVVEREMRPIAIGRRNWLFAGSFAAAERLADGITVVATARMHDVDPVAYLKWLLPQLARREWTEESARAHLLPANFKKFLEQERDRAGS